MAYCGIQDVDLANVYEMMKSRGEYVVWSYFTSCTSQQNLEKQVESLPSDKALTLFELELTTGRARFINQYTILDQGDEIVLPINSTFIIDNIIKLQKDITLVILKEIESVEPIFNFDINRDHYSYGMSIATPLSTGMTTWHTPIC